MRWWNWKVMHNMESFVRKPGELRPLLGSWWFCHHSDGYLWSVCGGGLGARGAWQEIKKNVNKEVTLIPQEEECCHKEQESEIKEWPEGHWDGSVGKGACDQDWKLSSIPGTLKKKEENQLLRAVLGPSTCILVCSHTHLGHMETHIHTQAHTHTQTVVFWIKMAPIDPQGMAL